MKDEQRVLPTHGAFQSIGFNPIALTRTSSSWSPTTAGIGCCSLSLYSWCGPWRSMACCLFGNCGAACTGVRVFSEKKLKELDIRSGNVQKDMFVCWNPNAAGQCRRAKKNGLEREVDLPLGEQNYIRHDRITRTAALLRFLLSLQYFLHPILPGSPIHPELLSVRVGSKRETTEDLSWRNWGSEVRDVRYWKIGTWCS